MIKRLMPLSRGTFGIDSPEGEKLLTGRAAAKSGMPIAMDRAYESDAIREKAVKCGFMPVVPPKRNRKEPWEDPKRYKKS
ncbi:MAG: hypothetical protein LBP79_02635 [Clostridiales bacterium]|jgi:hypothetical protein|nr:hypothetical protein [Clostridiales bacterium]